MTKNKFALLLEKGLKKSIIDGDIIKYVFIEHPQTHEITSLSVVEPDQKLTVLALQNNLFIEGAILCKRTFWRELNDGSSLTISQR